MEVRPKMQALIDGLPALAQPIFDAKIIDPKKFALVVGRYRVTKRQRV
jgi:hypothetical protein